MQFQENSQGELKFDYEFLSIQTTWQAEIPS